MFLSCFLKVNFERKLADDYKRKDSEHGKCLAVNCYHCPFNIVIHFHLNMNKTL